MQNDILPRSSRPGSNTHSQQAKDSKRLSPGDVRTFRQRLSNLGEVGALRPPSQKAESPNSSPPPGSSSAQPPSKSSKWRFWESWSRRRKIVSASLATMILALVSANVYFFLESRQPQSVPISEITIPEPTEAPSPLTGVRVPIKLTQRPVTGIMIENSLAARPQSGLKEAGIVFEAIAEGGITRFIALYQDAQPGYIGPVRSLRPYYLDFAAPFTASIAHVGGSPEALKQVRNGMRDLDQFFNPGAYWRVSHRSAPHNAYTSFARLDALNKSKGYKSSKFTSWPRKSDLKAKPPTATAINLNISNGALYNVRYDYDSKTNTYLRSVGGRAHVSTSSEKDGRGKRLSPNVVIALVMSRSTLGTGHSDYKTSGKGIAYIFQDGGVSKGTWVKKDRKGQFSFIDAKGKPISLNRGQSWVTIVPGSSAVSYSAPKAQ